MARSEESSLFNMGERDFFYVHVRTTLRVPRVTGSDFDPTQLIVLVVQ